MINTKLINVINSKVSEMISNQPTKSYASVLSDNFININKSINSINSDMHAIKINDENTVIFENLPTINNIYYIYYQITYVI